MFKNVFTTNRRASLAVLAAMLLVRDKVPAEAPPGRGGQPPGPSSRRYCIEQAMSDNAQWHSIALSGLAFITDGFGASTFLPPGKVCDFFGSQYMRDIDTAGKLGLTDKGPFFFPST